MQAMQINLNHPQDLMQIQSRNVQGQNSSVERENSFDSFLERQMNEETIEAKEGPPETQDTESAYEPIDETAKNAETEVAKTDSTVDTEKQSQKGDSANESEVAKDGQSETTLKKSGEDNQSEVSLEKSHEDPLLALLTQEAKGDDAENVDLNAKTITGENSAVIENVKKLVLDETEEKVDDAQLAFANVDSTKQVLNEVGSMKASETVDGKIDSIDGEVKSKQVMAEIPTISVQDERTVTEEAKQDGNFVRSVSYDGNGNATMDLSLNNPAMQTTPGTIINADGSVQQHTVTNAQQFGTMLSSELQSNSAELVKTGSIILKDGNQGTINLILHPEELGNVKVKLEISDNVLTGKITVASEEAYNAFKANMSSLKEAFDANGFDTAGFDLSWSGEGQGEDNQDKNDSRNPFGTRYDDNIAVVGDGEQKLRSIYGHEAYINVVA